MIRKSDIVRSLVAEHQYKKALRIAKDFRLGITPEQSLRMKKKRMSAWCMKGSTYPWVKTRRQELLKELKH